jgi:hypothetical protein
MAWELWIIPVIAVAVWIISQLRNAEEQGRVKRPPGPRTSEVDKFLEEINRMRRQSNPAPQESPRTVDQFPSPLEVLPAESAAPPLFEKPARPTEVRSQPRLPKPKGKTAKPTRVAVSRTRPPTEVRPASTEILDVIPVSAPLPAPAPPPPAPPSPPGSSPMVQVRGLLRTPGSLQTVFLLHEVIGPPRCRRRGRRSH